MHKRKHSNPDDSLEDLKNPQKKSKTEEKDFKNRKGCPIGSHRTGTCGRCDRCEGPIRVDLYRPGFCLKCSAWCCERCAPYDASCDQALYISDSCASCLIHHPLYDQYEAYSNRVCGEYWISAGGVPLAADREQEINHHFYSLCNTCRQHQCITDDEYGGTLPHPLQILILEFVGMTTAYVLSCTPTLDPLEELKWYNPPPVACHPFVLQQWQAWWRDVQIILHWKTFLECLHQKLRTPTLMDIDEMTDTLIDVLNEVKYTRSRLDVINEFAPLFLGTDTGVEPAQHTQKTWITILHFFNCHGKGQSVQLTAVAPNIAIARAQWFRFLVTDDSLEKCHDPYEETETDEKMVDRCRHVLKELLNNTVIEIGEDTGSTTAAHWTTRWSDVAVLVGKQAGFF